MWRNFFIITFSIYLLEQECDSIALEIGHYSNVTLESCGLKSLNTPFNSCFKWHQTIRQELQATKSIKGGGYAQTGEFPFTVLITMKSSYGMDNACTGSIVNSKWILTAAHCLNEGYTDFKVYAGITDFPHKITQKSFETKQLVKHPKFSESFGHRWYDIGLIKLKTAIRIRDEANSICMPKKKLKIEIAEMATFSGWGYLSDTRDNMYRLKKTQIKVTDFHKKIDANNLVIISEETIDGILCSGDSGGPLFQYINGRAVLIGTLMATVPAIKGNRNHCGTINATIFSSVLYHLEWIYGTIIKHK